MVQLKQLLETVVKGIVDKPEAVVVTATEGDRRVVLELKVDKGDVGKVIGRRGRMANALRMLMLAAGAKNGKRVTLDIIES